MTEQPGNALAHEEIAERRTVQAWLQSHGAHWNVAESDAETRAKLDVLRRFCVFCEKDPDELVTWLFRETPEGPRIRLKRRRLVMAQIAAFERGAGDPRQARVAGHAIRSFLIHNGVALSATPLR